MKFILCLLLLLSSSLSNKQLFEEIEKEIKIANMKNQAKKDEKSEEVPSLFIQTSEKIKNSNQKNDSKLKSLFESTNLNTKSNTNSNSKLSNVETKKAEVRKFENEAVENKKDKEISLLQKKLNRLAKRTDQLNKKLKDISNEDDEIVNFLEKQDKDVHIKTKKVESNSKSIADMSNKNSHDILFLGQKLNELEARLTETKKNNIVSNLTADYAVLGNMLIDGQKIKISDKTVFEIGKHRIAASELADTIAFVRKLKSQKKDESVLLNKLRQLENSGAFDAALATQEYQQEYINNNQ